MLKIIICRKKQGGRTNQSKKWPTKSWSCWKCCLTKARFPSGKFHHLQKNKQKTYSWWNESCTSWSLVYPIIDAGLYMPGGCLGFLPSTVNRISPTTIEIPNSSLDLEHLPNPKHPSGERDSHTGAGKRGRCFLISRGPCYLLLGDMFVWWKKKHPMKLNQKDNEAYTLED